MSDRYEIRSDEEEYKTFFGRTKVRKRYFIWNIIDDRRLYTDESDWFFETKEECSHILTMLIPYEIQKDILHKVEALEQAVAKLSEATKDEKEED